MPLDKDILCRRGEEDPKDEASAMTEAAMYLQRGDRPSRPIGGCAFLAPVGLYHNLCGVVSPQFQSLT